MCPRIPDLIPTMNTEDKIRSERYESLRDAETKAAKLFEEVERRQLVRAGITEKTLNSEVNPERCTDFKAATLKLLCSYQAVPSRARVSDDVTISHA